MESEKLFAVKIVENIEENMEEILQEYQILVEHSLHPNIPFLHGAFRFVLPNSALELPPLVQVWDQCLVFYGALWQRVGL